MTPNCQWKIQSFYTDLKIDGHTLSAFKRTGHVNRVIVYEHLSQACRIFKFADLKRLYR
jgi:hypothetical protein